MGNWQVASADRPHALTTKAIKSLRRAQVEGLSRRQLLRISLGAGIGLWLLEVSAGTLGFLWPSTAGGFGSVFRIGTLDDIKLKNANLPIDEGFPGYVADALAFIILVDPAQQRFLPGHGHER